LNVLQHYPPTSHCSRTVTYQTSISGKGHTTYPSHSTQHESKVLPPCLPYRTTTTPARCGRAEPEINPTWVSQASEPADLFQRIPCLPLVGWQLLLHKTGGRDCRFFFLNCLLLLLLAKKKAKRKKNHPCKFGSMRVSVTGNPIPVLPVQGTSVHA